jgi:hypothetical protein
MTQQFGRLDLVPVRNAWAHEAAAFTPWLAQNLDRLGEAIGFPLEHVQSEAPVAAFSADILARSVVDGSNVLIENQLEDSDHKHLGQIMTYLAGLSAHTVIWVAPKFREEHLSAIRWLNEHTAEPFSFLAVEIRVVRIGDSPLAPVFEVLERPNDWDRSVQQQAREARPRGALGEFRKSFWTYLLDRHPAERASGAADGNSSRWRPPVGDFVVSQYLAQNSIGLFIRGVRGVSSEQTAAELDPYRERLSARLGPTAEGNHTFVKTLRIDANDRANWDQMADWLHEQAENYVAALKEVLEGNR